MSTETKTAQQFIEELDRFVDLPENEKNSNVYLDTILKFVLTYPDEATAFLKPILPKLESFSNESARTLGRMCTNAFEGATFPYITFSESDKIPAGQVRNWLSEVVYPAAALERLIQQNRKIVMAAIWDVLRDSRDLAGDLSAEAANLAHDTWTWASQNLTSLLAEKEAKASTRLYAYSYWLARTFKTERLRAKVRFADGVDVDGLSREPDGSLLIESTSEEGGRAAPVANLFARKRKEQISTPSPGKMLCVPCQTVNAVLSEDESGNVTLTCQHSRPKSI